MKYKFLVIGTILIILAVFALSVIKVKNELAPGGGGFKAWPGNPGDSNEPPLCVFWEESTVCIGDPVCTCEGAGCLGIRFTAGPGGDCTWGSPDFCTCSTTHHIEQTPEGGICSYAISNLRILARTHNCVDENGICSNGVALDIDIQTSQGDCCTASADCNAEWGSCCISNGGCIASNSVECTPEVGNFQEHQSCIYSCNSIDDHSFFGACCKPQEGTCEVIYEDGQILECTFQNGEYYNGEVCSYDICPTFGVCCFEDGQCQEISINDCNAGGGDFHLGETCETGCL